MESRTTDVNGIRVRWEEHGEGEPVVFIHGIPTSPRHPEPVATAVNALLDLISGR